jgi:hypothetical protein
VVSLHQGIDPDMERKRARSGVWLADFEVPCQELADPGDRMIGDPGENGSEMGFRIDAIQFAGLDQRQDAGGTFSALNRRQVIMPDVWRLRRWSPILSVSSVCRANGAGGRRH